MPVLKTIKRTGDVLELFTAHRPEWGVTEAAAELGIPKSNAHEIMSSLAGIGLLLRTPDSRYRLGWRLLALSRDLTVGAGVQHFALPVMRQLARATGETAMLTVWDDGYCVCAARIVGRHGHAPPQTEVGRRQRPRGTAVGMVLREGEEVAFDARSVAVPARDHLGAVAAALSLTGDTDRVERLRDDYATSLTTATARMTRSLRRTIDEAERRVLGAD